MYSRGSPNAAWASPRVSGMMRSSSPAVCATRMPRPPPPPAAFTITGGPILSARRMISSMLPSSTPPDPGTVGTPAAFMA